MNSNKIPDLLRELRKEYEKMSKSELWEYCRNQYHIYWGSRDFADFEAGRFAYLFYIRKGGKRKYKWFEFKFNKPSRMRKRLFFWQFRRQRKKEERKLKRKRNHISGEMSR